MTSPPLPTPTSSEPMFCWQTARMGKIPVSRLRFKDWMSVSKRAHVRKDISASELTDLFIATLAKTEADANLTPEQIGLLSGAEKEDFAEQFLNAEDHMYRERLREETKDDKGNVTVKLTKGKITLPRQSDESATQYLQRAFEHYERETAKKMADTIGPTLNIGASIKNLTGWAKPSALNALSANAAISESLSAKISAMRLPDMHAITSLQDSLRGLSALKTPFIGLGIPGVNDAGSAEDDNTSAALPKPPFLDAIKLPRSPVYETNERLDSLIERFDRFEGIAIETVELVKTMNDAASGLLQSFGEGAKTTEQYARRSIRIAIIALTTTIFIAAFQLGYGIWQSRQQDGETKAIVENIVHQVTSSQQEASTVIRETINNQTDRVHADQAGLAKAITAVGEALHDLNERRLPATNLGSPAKP